MNSLAHQLDTLDSQLESDDNVIIEGFMDRYDVSIDEAKEILDETKKFLKLAAEVHENEGFSIFIDQPLLVIDEMWHTFILHTRQYVNFCFSQFNRFIHHRPTSSLEKRLVEDRMKQNSIAVLRETKENLSRQYSYIYDKYGAETLHKWYEEWAVKYTPEYLTKIKKAS